MDREDNDFETNQFLQQFHDSESQTKNYHLEEINQLSECIKFIKNGDNLENTTNSVSYILSHIENLESDDSMAIGPFILNYALDFVNFKLSAPSIHVLKKLINKHNQEEYYRHIKDEFIQNAIENSNIIVSYCENPLSDQINDLIFAFITFSKEMLNFSFETQLVHIIIDKCFLSFEEENLDQKIFRLKLILSITRYLNDGNKLNSIILFYQVISDIFNKVCHLMNLNNPQIYDLLLQIYDSIFETKPELGNEKTYNSIFEPLFDDFFHNYAKILNENHIDETTFLNILFNLSMKSFVTDLLNKYPIYDFFIKYLQFNVNDIDDDPTIDMNKIKISWDIVANFILHNPEQTKYAIVIEIPSFAFEICKEGTIEMKSYVIRFLTNILFCVFDPQIFEYAKDTNLLEILLVLVESLPLESSEYIIHSIASFIEDPKIHPKAKRILKNKARTKEVDDSLTHFIELYPDNDIYYEGTYILGYFEGIHDEHFNTCIEEEEDTA